MIGIQDRNESGHIMNGSSGMLNEANQVPFSWGVRKFH